MCGRLECGVRGVNPQDALERKSIMTAETISPPGCFLGSPSFRPKGISSLFSSLTRWHAQNLRRSLTSLLLTPNLQWLRFCVRRTVELNEGLDILGEQIIFTE
ncbi:hypothetical protein FRC18_011944 [Serendipita sp. 400]|nr:hypothetical protein FRC18_011944 [Serendipita sp. 400]